jgi:hypothetical protein
MFALMFSLLVLAHPGAEFALSLPDLVAPSSGCAMLASFEGVSPRSGVAFPFDNHAGSGTTGAKFSATDGNGAKALLPHVDGVFTLDGKSKIASTGLEYPFPVTNGAFNVDAIRDGCAAIDSNDWPVPILFDDQPGHDRRGLGVPGNSGITYDLVKLTAAFPGAVALRVEGVLGVSAIAPSAKLSFHVLCDGAPLLETTLDDPGDYAPFSLGLPSNARFLTLAVADLLGLWDLDGAAFAELRLVIGGNYADCNANQRPDPCDLLLGSSKDCDGNLAPDDCEWLQFEYGTGYPGAGGVMPQAKVSGCVATGAVLYYDLSHCLGGSLAFIVIGAQPAVIATDVGPDLLIADPQHVVPVKLAGVGAGKGVVTVFGTQAYGLMPYSSIRIQTFVADGFAAKGFASTAGLEVRFLATN